MSDDIKNRREIEQSESFHKAAKLISGLIPGGASAYELFTALVKPLHEKRREEWVKSVTLRLHKLETKGKVNLKELARNEEFNTLLTKATLIAQQNHQEEKIEALKNLVINTSLNISEETLDFEMADYFLSILDRINPIHILLLKIFRDPEQAGIDNDLTLENFIEATQSPQNSYGHFLLTIYPDLKPKKELIEMCWSDLHHFKLVKWDNLFIGDNLVRIGMELTTDLGNQFLKMIEED